MMVMLWLVVGVLWGDEVGGDEVAVGLVEGFADFWVCVVVFPVECAGEVDGVSPCVEDSELDGGAMVAGDEDAAVFDEEWFEALEFCEEAGAGVEVVVLFGGGGHLSLCFSVVRVCFQLSRM